MEKEKQKNWCQPNKCLSLLINNNQLQGRLNAYRTPKSNSCRISEKRDYWNKNRSELFDWKDTNCEKIMGARLANQLLKIGIKRMGQFEVYTKEQLILKGIKKSSTNRMWMHTDKMNVMLGI
jgi:hypothetical protein